MVIGFQRKDVRMASSLGKFLMDESLNDSLSTMLSIMAERRTSLDGANASFVESISANAELDANQTEKKATVRNSWLEHSWMDDATYDLNNIAEVGVNHPVRFACDGIFRKWSLQQLGF